MGDIYVTTELLAEVKRLLPQDLTATETLGVLGGLLILAGHQEGYEPEELISALGAVGRVEQGELN